MSKTLRLTIVRTLTLDEDSVEYTMTYDELVESMQHGNYDDWCWDDESFTLEVKPTDEVIIGE